MRLRIGARRGRLDLEATEMAGCSALHRAGAAALSQLLQFPAPSHGQRSEQGREQMRVSGRLGGDRQIGGAYGRGHRREQSLRAIREFGLARRLAKGAQG